MTATENKNPIRRENLEDEFARLEVAFRSGDRERLLLAVQHATNCQVQERLSLSARAELGDLIAESRKRLFMNGRA